MATKLRSKGPELFLNAKRADVWFVIENEEIPGHKLVLALACPYFDTMLYGETNEARATKIVLSQTKAKQFTEVLRFCYLEEIVVTNWTVQDLVELLTLAHEYQHKELLQRVLDIIEKSIKVEELNEVYKVASLFELPHMVEKCMVYAENNVANVLRCPKFKEYSADLVCALIERHGFLNHGIGLLMTALSTWRSLHTECELRTVLDKVDWTKVPLGQMSKIMKEVVRSHPDIFKSTCWEKLKLEEGKGQQVINLQLLTHVTYFDSSFRVAGPINCELRRILDSPGRKQLVLRFKRCTMFEIKQVEMCGIDGVVEVRLNDDAAEIFSSSVGEKYLVRILNSARARKEEDVLVITHKALCTGCRILVHGVLL